MTTLAIIALAVWLSGYCGAVCMALVCFSTRIYVRAIHLGSGPVLFARSFRGTKLSIGLLPSSSLDLPGMGPIKEDEAITAPPGRRLISDVPRPIAALAPLGLLVGVAGVAMALSGPSAAIDHIVSGPWQFVRGAASPSASGRDLVAAWAATLHAGGTAFALGVLMSKFVAWSLLPLGSSGLLQALGILLGVTKSRRFATIQVVATLLGMLVGASWLVALVFYFSA